MLSRKYRFHSRGGVKYVYKHGKTIRKSKMSLIFMPNERGFTRIAVVVSKKIDKRAVVRNRIRRQIYEALRRNMDLIPNKHDYIFVVYSRDVTKMKVNELEKLLGELVTESKICYTGPNGQE
ncbi:ribonuclease P protein component [Candidatus Saccharibacteria bacterium]|nr:ribonuclease P protein component [Candidatus Saccharibacteria bacterium]